MYPIFVVLLDGLADRAHDSLGGRTANEVAGTPNLDRFAAGGSCGLIHAVGPGRAPSSEVAHWAMLGCRPPEFPGRAVLEALGHGLSVGGREVLSFAALRPAGATAFGPPEAVAPPDVASEPHAAFDPVTGRPTVVWSARPNGHDPSLGVGTTGMFLVSTRG